MKKILISFLLLLSVANGSSAQNSRAVVLTIKSAVSSGSLPGTEVLQAEKTAQEAAIRVLNNKGWRVVRTIEEATSGLEVLIDISSVKTTGPVPASYVTSLGVYVISNGSSEVSNGKRVAFNYSSALAWGSGDPQNSANTTRKGIAANIEKLLNGVF